MSEMRISQERKMPLEELDKCYTFSDVKTKIIILAEGERTFTNNERKEIDYTKMSCISIRASGRRDVNGVCNIELPVLQFVRFLKWLKQFENWKYMSDLATAELEKNTSVSDFLTEEVSGGNTDDVLRSVRQTN